ncbi:MAG: hypothetical protein ACLFWB_09065 [Armatimonadota bacterium]
MSAFFWLDVPFLPFEAFVILVVNFDRPATERILPTINMLFDKADTPSADGLFLRAHSLGVPEDYGLLVAGALSAVSFCGQEHTASRVKMMLTPPTTQM